MENGKTQNFGGGSDPRAGAKIHKPRMVPLHPVEEIKTSNTNDAAIKAEMMKKLFGDDGIREFQKIDAKREKEKIIYREIKPAVAAVNKEAPNEPDSSGSKR